MKTLYSVDPSKFKSKRLDKGWSIRKLEKKSGVSRWTISSIEKGNHKVEELTLSKLLKALEANMEELGAYPSKEVEK